MTRTNQTVALTVLASVAIIGAASGQQSPQPAIPNFSGSDFGWLSIGTDFTGVPGGPQPVGDDPRHPHIGNFDARPGQRSSFRVGNLDNPNLTDFAKEGLKRTNDEVARGKAVFSREARCWPTGVPTYDLNQAVPVYFIQTPKEVVMIWQMDHQVRHIYLDVPHSQDPKLSWYGESVGHYEGDTLVVDTIGQNTKTFVDNYRTPHSEKLHVIERFRVINGGKNLEADIVMDDPATFKQPLHVTHRWRRVTLGPITESSCAESGPGFFDFDVEPIPTASKADF
jgi:hypothetical protein